MDEGIIINLPPEQIEGLTKESKRIAIEALEMDIASFDLLLLDVMMGAVYLVRTALMKNVRFFLFANIILKFRK